MFWEVLGDPGALLFDRCYRTGEREPFAYLPEQVLVGAGLPHAWPTT